MARAAHFGPMLLAWVIACGPTLPSSSIESGTSSSTGATETASGSDTTGSTSESTGDGDGDEELLTCEDCGPDELCMLVHVESEFLCGLGYSPCTTCPGIENGHAGFRCVPRPATCPPDGDACDLACLSRLCGDPFCAEPCPNTAADLRCTWWWGTPCSTLATDCAEGEKCNPHDGYGELDGLDTLQCAPVVGDATVGQPCTVDVESLIDIDTCNLDSLCWDRVDDGGQITGVCHAYCDEDFGCEPGHICVDYLAELVWVCEPQCTEGGDECGPNEVCVEFQSGWACTSQP